MTSRERLKTALRHQEPDRIPIDFGAMASTGITALAYAKLRDHLGMETGTIRVYDTGQQLAEPEKPVLDLLGVDVLDLRRSLDPAYPDGRGWKPWKLRDGTAVEVPSNFDPQPDPEGGFVLKDSNGRVVSRMPRDGFYFDGVYHPLEDLKHPSQVKDLDWESMKISDGAVEDLRRRAAFMDNETDYGLLFMGMGGVYEWGQGLRGWRNWIVDITGRRHIAGALIERMMEVNMDRVRKLTKVLSGRVQVLGFGDDLGMQSGPQMSPDTYREVLKPCHEEMFTYVKRHSDCFTFLHSCGSIYSLLGDLVDAGLDIINPVQISAADMDPSRLKAEFGEELTFWGGGADTQNVLGYRPVREVEAHVADNIEALARGGGFVFNQVHNVQPNVSPESLIAAYRTARKLGKY
jgi:uroporphyrinogen decarboxylase